MENIYDSKQLISCLRSAGVVIMPSDTLYGMFANAQNESAVRRVRQIKNRDDTQAFIVLCATTEDISALISPSSSALKKASNYWPAAVSIILEGSKRYPDIQGDLSGIAFRIPAKPELRELLKQTGPLVAPSANPKGEEPAKNIAEARAYFGDQVDLYVDGGEITNVKPSKVIKIHPDGSEEVLRA